MTSSPQIAPQISDLSLTSGPRCRSVSDMSVDSDINSSYDVSDEEPPQETFFAPAFQRALKRGLAIANSAADAIELSVELSDPANDLGGLLEVAEI